jgi:hypothetical protein
MSLEKLQTVVNEIEESKAKLKKFAQEQGKQVIGEAFTGLFDTFPKLERVEWTQYTPYFNDGESCTFGVHVPSWYSHDGKENDWLSTTDKYVKEQDEMFGDGFTRAALDLWGNINNEELLESVFGDHVRIIVTRNDITVEDHDHD